MNDAFAPKAMVPNTTAEFTTTTTALSTTTQFTTDLILSYPKDVIVYQSPDAILLESLSRMSPFGCSRTNTAPAPMDLQDSTLLVLFLVTAWIVLRALALLIYMVLHGLALLT
jgi:hypothetical protein